MVTGGKQISFGKMKVRSYSNNVGESLGVLKEIVFANQEEDSEAVALAKSLIQFGKSLI